MSRMRHLFCPGLKREIALPERIARAVSLSPSLTDTIFRLGLGDQLVGRSAWCHRPDAALALPVAGSYTSVKQATLDVLDPDLILTVSGAPEKLAHRLVEEGHPVYQVPLPVSPWGILDTMAIVAAVMGRPESASEPLAALHTALAALHGCLPRLRTYVEIDLGGPVTIGPGSYIYWSLKWMGLDVITPEPGRAYATPDDAALQQLAPGLVVYDPKPGRTITRGDVLQRFVHRGLGAWFEAGARIVVTEGDVLAHSGPWFIEAGLPWIAGRIQAADAGPV